MDYFAVKSKSKKTGSKSKTMSKSKSASKSKTASKSKSGSMSKPMSMMKKHKNKIAGVTGVAGLAAAILAYRNREALKAKAESTRINMSARSSLLRRLLSRSAPKNAPVNPITGQ